MNPVPYVMLYLIPATTSTLLAAYGWRQRYYRQARFFSFLMAAFAFWSLCHALSIADATLPGTLFWSKLQYGGIVLVGPFLLLFASAYADLPSWPMRNLWVFLFAPALLLFVAVLTNDWHQLWWTSVELDTSRSFASLAVERGILFWVHTLYTYGCILISIGVFIHTMVESSTIYRRQALLVIVGTLIPIFGNMAHLLGLKVPWIDDPTPFLFAATSLFLFYAALRYQLLDLAPAAQREVFENMTDGVVVLNRQGIIALINNAAPRLLTITESQWVGQQFLQIIADSPLALDLQTMLAASATPAMRRVHYQRDGRLYGVEVRIQPLHTGGGSLAGSLLVLHDITERVRMEQALDQRLEELTIINQMARTANAATHTDDLLRTVTYEITRSMGWDRVAIGLLQTDGATLHLVIDSVQNNTASLEGQYVTSANFERLLNVLHKKQTCVMMLSDPSPHDTVTERAVRSLGLRTLLAVPLYSQAQPIGIFVVGRTRSQTVSSSEVRLVETLGELVTEAITRTRLYEATQQASQRKSDFLATISHEFRTPLTSILGYEELLQRGVFGPLPEDMHEPLMNIRQSGNILLRLVGDILDFSKLAAGVFEIHVQPVDLEAIITRVVETMRPQICDRGLVLHLELADNLPFVCGNSERLEQVLRNLISNAVKFTSEGAITISAAPFDCCVRLRVQDTGIGIAPEHQEAVFQEFYQVQNTHTQHHHGTGLGLSISRKLIELMGGSMSLESEEGVGSTFVCDLRLAETQTMREIRMAE